MIITWKSVPHALNLISFLFCYEQTALYLVLKNLSEQCSIFIVRELFQHSSFLIPWGEPCLYNVPVKKKHSQQPEWLLVSDNTSKEKEKKK